MTADQLWSNEAREAIKGELRNAHISLDHLTKNLLAALADHAVPRATFAQAVLAAVKVERDERDDYLTQLSTLRQAVLDLAQQYDAPTVIPADGYDQVAAELRALAGGDQ